MNTSLIDFVHAEQKKPFNKYKVGQCILQTIQFRQKKKPPENPEACFNIQYAN